LFLVHSIHALLVPSIQARVLVLLLAEQSVELRFPEEGSIFPVEWSLGRVVMRKEGTVLLRRWTGYL
jgi:hypothetical protein